MVTSTIMGRTILICSVAIIKMKQLIDTVSPAKWVMGQIDYPTESLVFGATVENQAIALSEYENGVFWLDRHRNGQSSHWRSQLSDWYERRHRS